jgi:hypothetical protein
MMSLLYTAVDVYIDVKNSGARINQRAPLSLTSTWLLVWPVELVQAAAI